MELRRGAAEDARVLTDPTDFCRLWLFRHPDLDASSASVAVGSGPAELSRRGRSQVLQWIELLKDVDVAEIHCSPQPQCHDPARALAQQRGIEARTHTLLRDQEMGRWQGRRWDEVMQTEDGAVRTFFSEFGDAKAPGGENLGQAVERVLEWWTDTAPSVLGKNLVVVLPGSVLSGFAAAMLGMRLSRCVSLNLPHGGLGVLDVFQNGTRVGTWNATALLK
ncbi:MAG: hypothetical protein RIT25_3085 [Planctomycetota bacterium]